MKEIIVSCILVFVSLCPAYADTLYLRNGRSLEGLIRSEKGNDIELDVGFGTVTFKKESVERIYRSTPDEIAAILKKWEISRAQAELMKTRAEEERLKAIGEWKQKQEEEQNYGPKHVAFQREAGHMTVNAVLNKKANVSLLVDTGASLVLLTDDVARKLGIDTGKAGSPMQLLVTDGRKIDAKYVILDSVQVSDVEAKNVEAAILPSGITKSEFKDGLLGMSFLRRFNFKFDYNNDKLVLEPLR